MTDRIEVARVPVAVRPNSQRTLVERIAMRSTRVRALAIRATLRLRLRSRLRMRLTRHAVQMGTEAINRGDFAASFGLYHPEAEFVAPGQLTALGMEGTIGPAERIRFQQRWMAEWGEFRFEPKEVLIFGDNRRFMMVGRIRGSGRGSGAPFDDEWATLMTISDGWVVGERSYFDHAEAFEAAGLPNLSGDLAQNS
jgi:ketosteroid isomerase-like protein